MPDAIRVLHVDDEPGFAGVGRDLTEQREPDVEQARQEGEFESTPERK